MSIFKKIFEQNGERPNESMQPKDLKSKISEELAQKQGCDGSVLLILRSAKFGRLAALGHRFLFLPLCKVIFGLIGLKFWIYVSYIYVKETMH